MPRYVGILAATTVFFAPGLMAQRSRVDLGPRLISNTVSNPAPKTSLPQIMQVTSGLPLVFEPNLGQTAAKARYLTRAPGMTSYLTDRGNVMVLSRRRDASDPLDPHKTPEIEQTVVRMDLEGSHAPQHFEGLEKVESISNYFIGNLPSKWVTNVPNYRKVRASGVYPGIDLVYYGDGRELEYDFVVRPGANPGSIHLAYEGADSLTTDQEGNLLIATGLGTLVQRKPLVYQEINGERREVQASYSIRAGKVEFALANWDRRRALVIDPVLEYSTYLGGTGADRGSAIAVDGSGMAYVTGFTSGDNFPVTAGQTTFGGGPFDAFVTKLNPSAAGAAALVYTTYLGGTGNDYGYGIAVMASGVAYVTGATDSIDFPIFPTTSGVFQMTNGGGQDAFVTKLDTAGAILFSTYLGGSDTDQGHGIALDASGEAYVTGYTVSTDFPTMVGFQTIFGGGRDAFVTKLNEWTQLDN
jgi:hypothetical protein